MFRLIFISIITFSLPQHVFSTEAISLENEIDSDDLIRIDSISEMNDSRSLVTDRQKGERIREILDNCVLLIQPEEGEILKSFFPKMRIIFVHENNYKLHFSMVNNYKYQILIYKKININHLRILKYFGIQNLEMNINNIDGSLYDVFSENIVKRLRINTKCFSMCLTKHLAEQKFDTLEIHSNLLFFKVLTVLISVSSNQIGIFCDKIVEIPSENMILSAKCTTLIIKTRHFFFHNSDRVGIIPIFGINFQFDYLLTNSNYSTHDNIRALEQNHSDLMNLNDNSILRNDNQIQTNLNQSTSNSTDLTFQSVYTAPNRSKNQIQRFHFDCPLNFHPLFYQNVEFLSFNMAISALNQFHSLRMIYIKNYVVLTVETLEDFDQLWYVADSIKHLNITVTKWVHDSAHKFVKTIAWFYNLETLKINAFFAQSALRNDSLPPFQSFYLKNLKIRSNTLVFYYLEAVLIKQSLITLEIDYYGDSLRDVLAKCVGFEQLKHANITSRTP